MEYSIYKLSCTRDQFIEMLVSDNHMRRVGNSITYHFDKTIGEDHETANVLVDFYFKLDDNEIEIDWANYWAREFGETHHYIKTVESSYGMIVIDINGVLFGISLGRGHYYALKIADLDFGLDIAEMILIENTIQVKAAKYFKQSKNKSLTQYNRSSFVSSEIGESDEFIIGKINLDRKYINYYLMNYSERVKFGTAIKINVGEYSPSQLIEIVFELYCIYRNEFNNRRVNLPRIMFLKQNEDNAYKISDLNQTLLAKIREGDSINVALSYFIEDGGDIVIEPTNDSNVELLYNHQARDISFSIESITEVLLQLDCQDITKVTIRNKLDHSKNEKLVRLLDFITVYQAKNYCLYKGNWAIFNDSYINHIDREILKVNQIVQLDESYNLNAQILEDGREIMRNNPEYDRVGYAEYPYNIVLQRRLNYTLLDRRRTHELFQAVEFADLYDSREQNLIHVKIGSAKDIRYCIQQSLRSAEIFNRDNDVLTTYGITSVKKISMLFVVDTENLIENGNVDFGNSKSIYLKVELIEWMNRIRSLNYQPQIIVAKHIR